MLYNTLILPHITYGIMVWGHRGNRLNTIQKKAIRIITSSRYNLHTEPLFKQLYMLKLEDLLKLQQLKFYFKFNEGSLPVYLQKWDICSLYKGTRPRLHRHRCVYRIMNLYISISVCCMYYLVCTMSGDAELPTYLFQHGIGKRIHEP